MMRSGRIERLFVLWCSFVLAVPFVTGARAAEVRGVDWDSSVTIGADKSTKSQQELTSLLAEPWHLEDDIVTFDVENAGGQHAVVSSCDTLFRADADGMQPAVYRDLKIYRSWGSSCYAVRAVGKASAAKKSFVRDFSLDAPTVKRLPVELAFAISTDEVRKVEVIGAHGGSLGDYLDDATITPAKGAPIRGANIDDGSGGSEGVHWMASGDFDHDGVEDLLISTYSTVTGGNYAAFHLFLVTRTGPQAPLTSLDAYPVMGPGIADDVVENFRRRQQHKSRQ